MRFLPLCLVVLAACPNDEEGNPKTLWIAPDRVETEIKLVGERPDPY